MTFGSGGHAELLLNIGKRKNVEINLIASDRDPTAYDCAKNMALRYPSSVLPIQAK